MAAEPGRPIVVTPRATRPAIAKVIARRWSSRLSVSAPSRRAAAGDPEVVAVDLDPGAERPQAGGGPGDPVGLLVAELAGAADDGRAAGGGRGEAQDRDLVDRGGDVGRPELDGAERSRSGRRDRRSARRRRRRRRRRAGRSSMSAPIERRMSMTARRVGLTPTSRRISSASGWMAPATSQNAAAETSPGTRSVTACTEPLLRPSRPPRRPRRSVRSTGTPRARSIRSVWSRVATDSRTVVRPSARSPASRIADFT